MKQIFIALLLLPLAVRAQDCTLKKETDQFSQEPKLSTGFIPVNAGLDRVLITVDADGKEIVLLFSLKSTADSRCFDDASTAVVIFEGGTKLNLRNSGAMNCEGIFQLSFKNVTTTPSALQRFTTKKITSINLTGNKTTNIVLQDDQKQLLMDKISCLVKEAKTLIKKT
jgi:hypothetical protein